MEENPRTGGIDVKAHEAHINGDAVGRDKVVNESEQTNALAAASVGPASYGPTIGPTIVFPPSSTPASPPQNPPRRRTVFFAIGFFVGLGVAALLATGIIVLGQSKVNSPTSSENQSSKLVSSLEKDYVPFGSTSNPDELNPALKWWKGESKDSDYKVGERSLTVTSGAWTNQVSEVNTAPMVTYPITGDFTAQVMMVFDPSDGQYAGLGVKSIENDTTWLRITRARDGSGDDVVFSTNDQGNFDYVNHTSYSQDVIHLRIERKGKVFNLFYSPDGNYWSNLGETKFSLSNQAEVYFVVLGDDPASAQFRDLKITRP
jgi:regulation of enolase protein 1 (concanavalin A-like superfamily)